MVDQVLITDLGNYFLCVNFVINKLRVSAKSALGSNFTVEIFSKNLTMAKQVRNTDLIHDSKFLARFQF